jgi:hypothetical protein
VEGDSTPAASSESSGVNATDRAGSEPEPGPRVVRGEIAGPND